MEIGTEENESRLQALRGRVLAARAANQPVPPRDALVFEIDQLIMEANSGASYEQYFRWASLDEIGRIVASLRRVGLDDVAELTQQAIEVAFPVGLPHDDAAHEAATDWTEAQERQLEKLFKRLENHNGRVTNVLGRYLASLGQG
jgi:hypothetical protein